MLLKEKDLFSQYCTIALPAVITTWLMFIFYSIDTIFVGRFVGKSALVALNLTMPILHLPYAFSVMVTVGVGTRAAILIGKQKINEAACLFTHAVMILLIVGAFFGLIFTIFSNKIAYLLGARHNILNETSRYLRVSGFFQIFTLIAYTFEAFLRLENVTRIVMYTMGFATIVNIILHYVLIFVLQMGIVGSALATGVTLSVSGMIILYCYIIRAKNLRFIFVWPINLMQSIRFILHLGMSDFLSVLSTSVVMVVFNARIMNFFGENGLIAYSIVDCVMLVGTLTSIALVESMRPMTSFFFGMGNGELAWKAIQIGSKFILSFSGLLTLVILCMSKKISIIFLGENFVLAQQYLEYAAVWYGLALLPAGVNLIVLSYLTSIQMPNASIVIVVLRSWILSLAGLWIMPKFFGASAIWSVVLCSELLTLPLSVFFLIKHRLKMEIK